MSIIPSTPPQADKKNIQISNTKLAVFSTLAVVLWSYVITKLFVVDLDRWIVERLFPGYIWVLDLKLIFFLVLISVVSFLAKRLKFWGWFLYVVFFPLIVTFFYFPIMLYKIGSLNLAFFCFFSVIGFFRNFRYNVAIATGFSVSMAMALFARSTSVLYLSIFILVAILVVTFANRTFSAVKPGDAFKIFRALLGRWQGAVVKKVDEDQKYNQLSVIDPGDNLAKTALTNIEYAVVTNRIFLFSAKSLKKYQNSGIPTITAVFSTVFLNVITIIFFALMYGASYRIDIHNFIETKHPSYFTFFALSFKSMIFSSIAELTPVSTFSQSLNIFQNFSSIFIGVIFVSIIVAGRNQSLLSQIEETITKAEHDGKLIERHMLGRYQLRSMDDLVAELRRLQTGMLVVIDFFTKRLE